MENSQNKNYTGRKFKCVSLVSKKFGGWPKYFEIGKVYKEWQEFVGNRPLETSEYSLLLESAGSNWYVDKDQFEEVIETEIVTKIPESQVEIIIKALEAYEQADDNYKRFDIMTLIAMLKSGETTIKHDSKIRETFASEFGVDFPEYNE